MSKDYTVAEELASLKEIKQSAEQRISELSLNALNYVNDNRLHKAGGGSDLGFDWDFFVRATFLGMDAETGSLNFENVKLLAGDYDALKAKVTESRTPDIYSCLLLDSQDGLQHSAVTTGFVGMVNDILVFMAFVIYGDGNIQNCFIWLEPGNVVSIHKEAPSGN